MEELGLREHVIAAVRSDLYRSIETWLPTVRPASGDRLEACNPIRGDQDPGSMSIYPDGTAFDYAANQKLDTIDLWASVNGMSNGDAIKYHAKRLGLNATPAPRVGATHYDKPIRVAEPATLPEPNVAPKPYPADAFTHYQHGTPSLVHTYKNLKNQLIGYTCRFDLEEGRKEVLPFSWSDTKGREKEHTGKFGWHWNAHGWNGTWPIYGAEKIDADADAIVVIVEGEKTADAAQTLLPDYVVLSWAGGCGKAAKVDWSPLLGRSVFIWPDADQKADKATGILLQPGEQPGMKAAIAIGTALADSSIKPKIIVPPADVKDGWDLADGLADGWNTNRTTAYILQGAHTLDELIAKFNPPKPRLSVVPVNDDVPVAKVEVAEEIKVEPKKEDPKREELKKEELKTPQNIAKKFVRFLQGELGDPILEMYADDLKTSMGNSLSLAQTIRAIPAYQYFRQKDIMSALEELGIPPFQDETKKKRESPPKESEGGTENTSGELKTPYNISRRVVLFLKDELTDPVLEKYEDDLRRAAQSSLQLAQTIRAIPAYQYFKQKHVQQALEEFGIPSEESASRNVKRIADEELQELVCRELADLEDSDLTIKKKISRIYLKYRSLGASQEFISACLDEYDTQKILAEREEARQRIAYNGRSTLQDAVAYLSPLLAPCLSSEENPDDCAKFIIKWMCNVKHKLEGRYNIDRALFLIFHSNSGENGKTTFVKNLLRPFNVSDFNSSLTTKAKMRHLTDDRYYESFSRSFVLLLEELDRNESHMNALKDFVTSDVLVWRNLGTHSVPKGPNRMSCIGTANTDDAGELLQEETGGIRRYIGIHVDAFHDIVRNDDGTETKVSRSFGEDWDSTELWQMVDPTWSDFVPASLREKQEKMRTHSLVEDFVEAVSIETVPENQTGGVECSTASLMAAAANFAHKLGKIGRLPTSLKGFSSAFSRAIGQKPHQIGAKRIAGYRIRYDEKEMARYQE